MPTVKLRRGSQGDLCPSRGRLEQTRMPRGKAKPMLLQTLLALREPPRKRSAEYAKRQLNQNSSTFAELSVKRKRGKSNEQYNSKRPFRRASRNS